MSVDLHESVSKYKGTHINTEKLTMNVKLELILLQVRVHFHSSLQHTLPQIFQPRNMLLLKISQTPNIPSMH